jgi:hypothetical protein
MTEDTMKNKMESEIREIIGLTAKDLDQVMYYIELAYAIGAENSYRNNEKPVEMINHYGVILAEFDSVAQAAKKMNISKQNIAFVCNGKRRMAGNYKWRWKKL